MVQQKRELSLGRGDKDIHVSSPSPRYYGHIGWNRELCPLTATDLGCVWRSVASREGHVSRRPGWLWPYQFQEAMSPASSLLPPRESSSIN